MSNSVSPDSSSIFSHLEVAADNHIITGIKRNLTEGTYQVTTAPSTFFNRTIAWLYGTNKSVADTIIANLKEKYGEEIANAVLNKADHDYIKQHGLNALEGRQIYTVAVKNKLKKEIPRAEQEANDYYKTAAQEEEHGNSEVAQCYSDAGKAKDAQIEALLTGDKGQADLQSEIADALVGRLSSSSLSSRGIHYYYRFASSYEKEGKTEAAKLFRCAIKARKDQIEALKNKAEALASKDNARVLLQDKISQALGEYGGASYYYRHAVEESLEGNTHLVSLYCQAAEASKIQAQALTDGDKGQADLQSEIAESLASITSGAVSCYKKATEAVKKRNPEAATLYRQAGEAKEAEVRALQDQIKALTAENKTEANLQKKRASFLEEAREYYDIAANDLLTRKILSSFGKFYLVKGKSREAKAEALYFQIIGDEGKADLQEKIAETLEEAASNYHRVHNGSTNSEHFQKVAETREAQAEALIAGNETEANL